MKDLTDLEVSVALAELERSVIAAEAHEGRNIPDAHRPLSEVEFAAGVRFGDMDRLVQDTATELVAAASKVTDHILDALPDLLAGMTPAQTANVLTRLASPTSGLDVPGIDTVLGEAHAECVSILTAAWERAAQGMLDEATTQGGTDLPAVVPVDSDTADIIDNAASLVISTWVSRAMTAAAEAARRATDQPATDLSAALAAFDVVEAIRQAVLGASTRAVFDLGKQGAHQTVSAARGSQALAPGMPPIREVYASELLDGKTCDPCAAMDGTNFDSMQQAWQYYRQHGGNLSCEGGLRCRGVLVVVFDTEQAPTVTTPPVTPTVPIVPLPPVPAPPAPAPAPAPEPVTHPVTKVVQDLNDEVLADPRIRPDSTTGFTERVRIREEYGDKWMNHPDPLVREAYEPIYNYTANNEKWGITNSDAARTLLDNAPEVPRMTWRGMDFEWDQDTWDNLATLQPGDLFDMRGEVSSFTTNRDIATRFANNGGRGSVVMEYENPRGIALEGMTHYAQEQEVLIGRQIVVRAVNVDHASRTIVMVVEDAGTGIAFSETPEERAARIAKASTAIHGKMRDRDGKTWPELHPELNTDPQQ